eukprot:Nk52_evm95s221 gene=Nk52_evmTU95s221
MEAIKGYMTSVLFRMTATATITLVASNLITITPASAAFGELSFFCSLMTILAYSGVNTGMDLVSMVWALLGTIIGMGAVLSAALIAGTGHGSNVTVLLLLIFAVSFTFSYLYAKYPPLSTGFLAANLTISVMWRFIYFKESEEFYILAFSFWKSFSMGALFPFLVNLVLFPKSAGSELVEKCDNHAELLKELMMASFEAFCASEDVGEKDAKVTKCMGRCVENMSSMKVLLKHSKAEPCHSQDTHLKLKAMLNWYQKITDRLVMIAKHGCSKNEQSLSCSSTISHMNKKINVEFRTFFESCCASIDEIKNLGFLGKASVFQAAEKLEISTEEFYTHLEEHYLASLVGEEKSQAGWTVVIKQCYTFYNIRELASDLVEALKDLGSPRQDLMWTDKSVFFRMFDAVILDHKPSDMHERHQEIWWRNPMSVLVLFLSSMCGQYALKTSIMILVWSIPCYFEGVDEICEAWQQENILITIFMVILPSAGGSFLRCLMRLGGVVLGASYAALTWVVTSGDALWLTVLNGFGFFLFFHVRFHFKFGWTGTVGLFMQNLTILYKYQNKDAEEFPGIGVLTYKIIVDIALGVFTVILLTLVIWPYSDVREVQSLLSTLSQDLSLHYQDIMTYLHMTEEIFDSEKDSLTEHTRRMEKISKDVITRCEQMIYAASQQPRPHARNKFEEQLYSKMLSRFCTILDMNTTLADVVFTDFSCSMKQFDYWYKTNQGRKDILSATSTLFYLITGALKANQPLPPFLPNPHTPRNYLYSKFNDLAKEFEEKRIDSNDTWVLVRYFSYCFSALKFMDCLNEAAELVCEEFGVSGISTKLGVRKEAIFSSSRDSILRSLRGSVTAFPVARDTTD